MHLGKICTKNIRGSDNATQFIKTECVHNYKVRVGQCRLLAVSAMLVPIVTKNEARNCGTGT
jgi:hypothetical protein